MKCSYCGVCIFYLRKVPIHDVMYKTNVSLYCENDFKACAIFEIIQAKSLLDVPKDIYPNQSFRVADIINK